MASWDFSQDAKLVQHTKIQIDLQIECNLYQKPAAFFSRHWQADPNINMEMQGTHHSQDSLEK